MKTVAILVLLVAAVAAQCNNPLLARSEVSARFGGSANIQTSATTSSNLGVCSLLLTGKQVCVSDAGFAAFGTWLNQYKAQFVAQGSATRQSNLGGVTSAQISQAAGNSGNCINNYVAYVAFVSYAALTSSLSASATIDFSALSTALKAGISSQLSASQQTQLNMVNSAISQYNSNEGLYLKAKAMCAQQIFKHLITVTCAAAASDYSSWLSGSSSNPVLKEKSSSCATFRNNCLQYFTLADSQMAAAGIAQLCANSNAQAVATLLGNGTTFSSSVNSQLNTIWNNVKSNSATLSIVGTTSSSGTSASAQGFVGLTCSSSMSTASDCDFICQNVLNATGFKANAFNNLNMGLSNRLLADSSMSYGSDGLSPDTQASDNDAMVAQENSTASAFGLFVSFAGLIAGLLLL